MPKITAQLTDEALIRELGGRLAAARIERELTQAALAEQAGVSKRTLERLESGQVATQLSSLLRVCRVLGLIERFDALLPPPGASPIAQLKQQDRRRQRVSVRRAQTGEAGDEPAEWSWGDEP